jgi:hypothetical protein
MVEFIKKSELKYWISRAYPLKISYVNSVFPFNRRHLPVKGKSRNKGEEFYEKTYLLL